MEPKTMVVVQLSGENGNVFSLIGRIKKALKKAGYNDLAQEFRIKALNTPSYDGVLRLCDEYVKVR